MSAAVYDIAVVGSGFGGSLLAMIAHRLGRSVILLEKGKHPRFAIGESSTPLANLLLEELATRYDLPAIRPLSKWGTWQRAYPHVACGLKRGFTFYHHTFDAPADPDPDRVAQLLVAASPHDDIADTHWYRAEFDHLFVREAEKLGVEYLDEVALRGASESEDEIRIEGTKNGREISVRARFVVDATGPRGFLHRAFNLAERSLPDFPATQALFSHFSGVQRLGDTQFRTNGEAPPYSMDDAAVHHVFDGGWVWILRFNNGITSAGIAATDDLARRLDFEEGAPAWDRLLSHVPALRAQFQGARAELPFTHMPRLSFRTGRVVGSRWALLPSAAGFVDPLLSTGFTLTLSGVARLAAIFEADCETEALRASLDTYAEQTDGELIAAARLVASLYRCMGDFPQFVSLSLLYFAAVGFSETARRLGKPHLAGSFLLLDHPVFGPQSRALLDRVLRGETGELRAVVLRLIEPFDVAGLSDGNRRNWYPVEAGDLFRAASKVGATHEEISQLLHRCGFRL